MAQSIIYRLFVSFLYFNAAEISHWIQLTGFCCFRRKVSNVFIVQRGENENVDSFFLNIPILILFVSFYTEHFGNAYRTTDCSIRTFCPVRNGTKLRF